MKICQNCKTELNRFLIDEKIIYSHPPGTKCDMQDDGLKIELTVISPFMLETFQKSIIDCPEHTESQVTTQISPKLNESNLDKIKVRLADGNLNWHEFDCIKQRLDIKDD